MKQNSVKLFSFKLYALFIGLSIFWIGLTSVVANPILNEKQKLIKLEKEYKLSKSLYLQKRNQVDFEKKYLAATLFLADTVMISTVLIPKIKYPEALRLYREVLTLQPKNKSARKNKDLIESIYRSMGRPIPKK